MRKTLTPLLVVLLAVFGFGSIGEAAQNQSVRRRPKHSTHVTTGSSTLKKTPKKTSKKTLKKKATKPRRQDRRTAAASKHNTAAKPK